MARTREVLKYDKDNREVCRYNSVKEASLDNNISRDKLTKYLKSGDILDGYYFCYMDSIECDSLKNSFVDINEKRLKTNINRRIKFSLKTKSEELFVEDFIKPLGLEFIHKHYIDDISQVVDIFIPNKNIIIEYDGDFWHCNEAKFPNGPIYDYQKKKIEKDKEETEYCKKNNIELIRFWKSDVKNNPEMVKERLNKIIS